MNNYMEYSTFVDGNKRADVVRDVGNPKSRKWGVRYTLGGNNLGIEWYEGKAESYAESAAENFVRGIKTKINGKIVVQFYTSPGHTHSLLQVRGKFFIMKQLWHDYMYKNSKEWQKDSDDWVKTMTKSKESKEKYQQYVSEMLIKREEAIPYRDWLKQRSEDGKS